LRHRTQARAVARRRQRLREPGRRRARAADVTRRRDARLSGLALHARPLRRDLRAALRTNAHLGRPRRASPRQRLRPRALLRDHLTAMAASTPFTRFNYPVSYRLGCGRIRELAATCRELALRRPLVVTDPGVRRLPWFAAIEQGLAADGLTAS